MEKVETLGLVREGKFIPLDLSHSVKVTETGIVEATSPSEMNLSEYEGKVIMISGEDDGGDTIYGAKVIDVANPILAVVVQRLFNK
jgi:hypothetical protein